MKGRQGGRVLGERVRVKGKQGGRVLGERELDNGDTRVKGRGQLKGGGGVSQILDIRVGIFCLYIVWCGIWSFLVGVAINCMHACTQF